VPPILRLTNLFLKGLAARHRRRRGRATCLRGPAGRTGGSFPAAALRVGFRIRQSASLSRRPGSRRCRRSHRAGALFVRDHCKQFLLDEVLPQQPESPQPTRSGPVSTSRSRECHERTVAGRPYARRESDGAPRPPSVSEETDCKRNAASWPASRPEVNAQPRL
jgi:hypothetical protein